MIRKGISIVALSVAAASPVAAKPVAAKPVATTEKKAFVLARGLANMLSLRLRSIELQIDIMRDRDLIGREEAQDLRREASWLEKRLRGASSREAGAIELAVQRLQDHLRFATADLNGSRRRDLGRFDDGDRYGQDRRSFSDGDSSRRPDPRGDPFAIWDERDSRGPH